ncbi:hypothetical protein Tco_1038367, partial [Tanacetum coccineum]
MIRGNVMSYRPQTMEEGYQQQNKRQNTGRAYTAGTGEKREYTVLPDVTKIEFNAGNNHCPCVQNATITTKDHVLPDVTN